MSDSVEITLKDFDEKLDSFWRYITSMDTESADMAFDELCSSGTNEGDYTRWHCNGFLAWADMADDEPFSFTTNEGDSSSLVDGGQAENRPGIGRTQTILVKSIGHLVPLDAETEVIDGVTYWSAGYYCSAGYPYGSQIWGWQKGQLLGRGSFGSVYEGISGNGDFFAAKEVSLLDQGTQAQECIQQLEGEISLLSQLQHQNIVRYRGSAKNESNLYIFLELVTQGSLLKLYKRYQLKDSHVSLYTRQILDGLNYLHGEGFIHRDIKCANILVDASGIVKIADFGLAKVSNLDDIKSCKGTPYWMAPEVTAMYRIGMSELPTIPDTLSLYARDFILKCLNVNPEQRPTAAELLNHPFIRNQLLLSFLNILQ